MERKYQTVQKTKKPQKEHRQPKSEKAKRENTKRENIKREKTFEKPFTKGEIISSLFNPSKISEDACYVLEHFDGIVQSVLPVNSRQKLSVPQQIRELSHQLTDERDRRHLSYMNEKTALSAYVRYYMWWNLVRLVRLFSNIDFSKLNLNDESVCLDIGSGPLTAVCALWLACPSLRSKKLTWYCLDVSQQALSVGEEIFLSIAARAPAIEKSASGEEVVSGEESGADSIWKIIKVKGAFGAAIRQKADFAVCANMFNEAFQSDTNPPDFIAKKYCEKLISYTSKNAGFMIVEPGIPRSARFISLLRDAFMRRGYSVCSPCPHSGICPMDGRRAGQSGATGKWCNFSFSTEEAPKALHSLSKQAGIPKERAVLSFVYAVSSQTESKDDALLLRIVSDPIRLPGGRTGFYACCKKGIALAVNKSGMNIKSGMLVASVAPQSENHDAKTGALIVDI